MIHEHLQQASHTAAFTLASLQEANKSATAVESMVLLPLIANAAALVAGIKNLWSSIDADSKEAA